MRLKLAQEGEDISLNIPHSAWIILQQEEKIAEFYLTPQGIWYDGKRYYPQNKLALDQFLISNMELLRYPYQYLEELFPFKKEEVQTIHFQNFPNKGFVTDEDIPLEEAYERLSFDLAYVWKKTDVPHNSDVFAGQEEWTFTLLDGRQYICYLAGWDSYLQDPQGEILVRFFHPFTNPDHNYH